MADVVEDMERSEAAVEDLERSEKDDSEEGSLWLSCGRGCEGGVYGGGSL